MKKLVISIIVLFILFFSCKKSESPSTPATTNNSTPTLTLTPTNTFYPTSTPNPNGDNVFGTLTLPAAQPGKQFVVVADNDYNGGNGYVVAAFGICGSSSAVSYSFTVPNGTYYIMAIVDVSGTGFKYGPVNGDYFGYYGGNVFNPPPNPNAVVSGPSNEFNFPLFVVPTWTPTSIFTATITPTHTPNNTNTPIEAIISGNLILPQPFIGSIYKVSVDTDLNPINGAVSLNGVCNNMSTTIPYSITVTPGTYYVYAWIDANQSVYQTYTKAMDVGDYFGYYGTQYPNFPSSPNVTVIGGNPVSNININMYEGTANVKCIVNYPANSQGVDAVCIADTDLDGGNGFLSMHYVASLPSGISYEFDLCVPLPGNYYLFGFVDKVDPPDIWNGPSSGDYIGFYGSPIAVYINPTQNYAFTFTLSQKP